MCQAAEDSEASPGSRQCGLDNRGFTSLEVTACSPERQSTGNTASQGYTGNKVTMNSGSLAAKQIGPKTVRVEVTLRQKQMTVSTNTDLFLEGTAATSLYQL